MTADLSTVIVVEPDDTVDAIIERVRDAGAAQVQMLVPTGGTVLETLTGCAELALVLGRERISLEIVSPDGPTLHTARRAGIAVLPVGDPPRPAIAPDVDIVRLTEPDDERLLLDAMEQMPTGAYDSFDDRGVSFDDYDVDLDEPVSSQPSRSRSPLDADDFAEDIPPRSYDEDWDVPLGTPVLSAGSFAYPEDDDEDDWRSRERRTRPIPKTGQLTVPAPDRRRAGGNAPYGASPVPAQRPRSLLVLVPLLALLALAAAAAFWYFTSRATVQVWPAPLVSNTRPFTNEIIPLSEQPAPSGAAVQAREVSADVDVTVEGRASTQLTPVGVARGTVSIINRLQQAVDLPQGTEFVASNSAGQEVRFLLDTPARVPPAVVSTSLTGSTTTFGQVDVIVSARSPGSASNVAENTVSQFVVLGQPPISSGGTFTILNAPISGGSEEEVAIVGRQDVANLLPGALTKLYEAAGQRLDAQASGSGALDRTTIAPGPETLNDPASYEISVVNPSVGQRADPNNPVFTMTVRTRFSGLVTPNGQPVKQQLETVVPAYFSQRGDLPCGPEAITFDIPQYRWDGRRLTISGAIICTPRPELSAEALSQVRGAVSGRSREAAAAGLDELQRRGIIGGYVLPDKVTFPRFELLLRIDVIAPPPVVQPASRAPVG
jgi:hypothetical protein